MRRGDELRSLEFETGVQLHAAGSCLVKLGRTHVLCSASLEDKVPGWMKGRGTGWLTAEYGMLPAATNTRSDREASRGKQQGARWRSSGSSAAACARPSTWPPWGAHPHGGLRCAERRWWHPLRGHHRGLVAVALALKARGLEAALVRQVAAVSAGLVEFGEGRRGLVLDLEYEEDHRAAVDCNLVAARPGGGGATWSWWNPGHGRRPLLQPGRGGA